MEMTPDEIQKELVDLLYPPRDGPGEFEAWQKIHCDASDRETLTIIIRKDKVGHFYDFLMAFTEWAATGAWKGPEMDTPLVEKNVVLEIEFLDSKDECIGRRIIDLLEAYNKKVVKETVLYSITKPVEEGTLHPPP
jgi:hypothetical protein